MNSFLTQQFYVWEFILDIGMYIAMVHICPQIKYIYLNKLTFSPIVGEKKGNIEFIGLFSKRDLGKLDKNVYCNVVEEAHKVLKGGR